MALRCRRGQYAATHMLLLLLPVAVSADHASDAGADIDDHPVLSEFSVVGVFPSNEHRVLPFTPTFEATNPGDHLNYRCTLDFTMEVFTLFVDSQPPAILSKITQGGRAIMSRENLTRIRLAPGEKTIFEVGVTDKSTRLYTLIIQRRSGSTTELRSFTPITGNLTRPYHAGELQEHFQINQAFYEDFFEYEFVKADSGQNITFRIEDAITIGDEAPSTDDVYYHPHTYIPALELLNKMHVADSYDVDRGPTVHCKLPIDTWRKVTTVLRITSADKSSNRELRLIITRRGCPRGKYYHDGRCLGFCPTYYYAQKFNWRCGTCNTNCEFCQNWHKCEKCRRETRLYKYHLQDDGTCLEYRAHNYKVYYEVARYLAASCAVLLLVYLLLCIVWCSKRICCGSAREDDEDEEKAANAHSEYSSSKRNLLKMNAVRPAE
eukprot:gnl/TRDRNA2_/TRDRNA2_80033_c0_seq2.p1 gnl/TRDRNA2_/TRDRNA2_80033_c0~~gnl/TRDRNA2_/TRDRNA2_80033_c0_seq2.p1  ORF type:complete len:435 (-),score=45.09 gnl/TRDRNA2_/TRDRNA2_80033_c0_seq2:60-1364(-)